MLLIAKKKSRASCLPLKKCRLLFQSITVQSPLAYLLPVGYIDEYPIFAALWTLTSFVIVLRIDLFMFKPSCFVLPVSPVGQRIAGS